MDPLAIGTVSTQCRLLKVEGLHVVFVKGVEMFCYHPSDKLAKRTVWVQVCENGFALHRQVAKTTGIALRTLQYWIARYREEGTIGLVDKPKSGALPKVTDELQKRMVRLRSERATVREIAAKCRLSIGGCAQGARATLRAGGRLPNGTNHTSGKLQLVNPSPPQASEQLKPESKRLSNVIKTVACDVETELVEMPHTTPMLQTKNAG